MDLMLQLLAVMLVIFMVEIILVEIQRLLMLMLSLVILLEIFMVEVVKLILQRQMLRLGKLSLTMFMVVEKKLMHKSLGVYFPLIALNSAVLGLAVNNIGAGYNFVESLVAALGVGLGFMLAMFLFAGVQSRINEKYVPKAFRGLPVSLLTACIISLALFAF